MTLGGHLAGCYIDQSAFDAAATNINAQDFHGARLLSHTFESRLLFVGDLLGSLHHHSTRANFASSFA
jgi:hypothetical protein